MKFVILALVSCVFLVSCGTWSGSLGQQTVQHYYQYENGGKYVGNATSETEAKQKVLDAGYRYYNYYPSTGECFGYN